MMAAIRGKDTKPEMRVRRYLHAAGFRYVLGGRGLPGRPDLVFPSRRAVVFVHGCYWHRHPHCRYTTTPSTRRDFWLSKFRENVQRDARVERELREAGWDVHVIWGCETTQRERLEGLRAALDALDPC